MNRLFPRIARAVLFLAVTFCAAAQTTTITATMTDPMGDLLSGSCSIQGVGGFTAASGWRVIGAPSIATFTRGAFSVALAPTDSALPSAMVLQYYRVTCAVPLQTVGGHLIQPYSWGPRYWSVPTSSVSVDIGTIEMTSAPPQPTPVIPLTAQPSDGQYIKWSAALGGWQPVTFAEVALSYTTPPSDGQYIRWNASQSAWQPVTFVDAETVSGAIDGVNATFSLAATPAPAAGLVLFRNGIVQKNGLDYSLAGATLTFMTASIPYTGDTLLAWYRY